MKVTRKVEPVVLTGKSLTVDEVARVARRRAEVRIAPEAEQAICDSVKALETVIATKRPLYGLTTGVGALDHASIGAERNAAQQLNLLRSHAAGAGAPMPIDQVRAQMLTRLNMLCVGLSGIRLEVVQALAALLNRGVTPYVPEAGSVGASDLAPLAHMALVLVGEGRAWFEGELLAADLALTKINQDPVTLQGRDGFALINGLSQSTGIGSLALNDTARLIANAEAATALGMAALGSRLDSLNERVLQGKPHSGSLTSARRLRRLFGLKKGDMEPQGGRLREALSTRTAHHVLGSARDALGHSGRILRVELNATVDNPLVAADGWIISNAANVDGQHLAQAFDGLLVSLVPLAVMSERRTARLLDPAHNGGLPAFLVNPRAEAGINNGLMLAQYTAAALVAELRTRTGSAGMQSIPTCNNTEDHVSMCALAARQVAWAVSTAEIVVAIELLVAAQACDIRGTELPTALDKVHQTIRTVVPVMVEDRILSDDIQAVLELIRGGELTRAAR